MHSAPIANPMSHGTPCANSYPSFRDLSCARFNNTWALVDSGPAEQDQIIRESPTIKHCHVYTKCKLSPIFGLFVDINISQCRRSAAAYQVGSLTRGNMNWTSLSSLTLPGRNFRAFPFLHSRETKCKVQITSLRVSVYWWDNLSQV